MKCYAFIFCLLAGSLVWSAPVRDQHVSAELISEVAALRAGSSFWVALKLVHDEHWHTYWLNDGDSGLPTSIRWELPEGFSAGPIVWPYPQRIAMPPLVSFGYEGEAWLLVEITPPDQIVEREITLAARVSWLMCKEVCIPGRVALSLTLPVADEAALHSDVADAFAGARRKIPSMETDWRFAVAVSTDAITLTAMPPSESSSLDDVEVFPVDKDVISNSGALQWDRAGENHVLTMPRENTVNPLPETFRAVLVSRPGMAVDPARPAIEIEVPFAGRGADAGVVAPPATTERSLWVITVFAFFGGIILNLMPCVFPVISLKILGFVKQAGEDPKAVWHHGLVFAAGVVVSFWILAGALMALRAGGASIGWGFQLQSPEVLILLSLLFFILALNLFGVFEFGLSLTAAGQSVAGKQGWAGSFFSGMLATVIATPCTAPFMGVALGYALTQPPYVAMIVFSALAFGMASPYLLLSRYPALLKKLPRPGAWMETMKQAMGFLLMATVVWLFWVLSALTTSATLTWVVVAFLFAALGVWVFGKWDTLARSRPVRLTARLIGALFLVAAAQAGMRHIEPADHQISATPGEWEAFSPERLAELRQSGQPVFIDFTAKWCLTCQVNKMAVLRTGEIMQAFRDRGVALLVADWTDENEVISAELARHGRQSVPVYVLYTGDPDAEAILLPELLTRRIVLDALTNLN